VTAYNRNTLLVGLAVALVIGAVVSYFASDQPDGLEKTQQDLGITEAEHEGLDAPPLVFNEYGLKWLGEGFWANAIAGVVGSLLVLGLLVGLGRLLRRRSPKSVPDEPSPDAS